MTSAAEKEARIEGMIESLRHHAHILSTNPAVCALSTKLTAIMMEALTTDDDGMDIMGGVLAAAMAINGVNSIASKKGGMSSDISHLCVSTTVAFGLSLRLVAVNLGDENEVVPEEFREKLEQQLESITDPEARTIIEAALARGRVH